MKTATETKQDELPLQNLSKNLSKYVRSLGAFSRYLKQLPINPIHEEWAKWLFSPVEHKTFRQLLAHRESYKTTVLSIAVARHLLFNPNLRIGVVRSTKEEGKLFIKTVRGILESERFMAILIQLGLAIAGASIFAVDNSDSLVLKYRQVNYKEGTLDAIGYEQSVTGRHYDILLFDDFVTIQDRLSPTIRKKKFTYANEFVHNILTKNGLAINLGTFWHKEDSNQRFKQAYQNDQELYFDEKVYPLGTVFGESEADIKAFRLSKVKGLGQALYSANYELSYKEDEDLPFGKLEQGVFSATGEVIATIDPGYGGDATAMSIGVKHGETLTVVGKYYRQSVYDLIDEVANTLATYQVSKCYIEENADKGATVLQLRGKTATKIIGFSATRNKQYRIMANLKPRWENIHFDLEKSDGDYLIEVSEWNSTASKDDAPDSLAKLVEVMNEATKVADPSTWV